MTADLIPKYLLDIVKDRPYEIEDFYKYQSMNCLINGKNGVQVNPLNHLYLLVDDGNKIVGFLWFVIEPLTKDLFITTFSVDPEFWYQGKAMKLVSDHVKDIMKKAKIKKAYWTTKHPKHSEKYGFKRSRQVLMEYREE